MFKKIQKAICYFWLFAIFAPFFLCAFHPMQRGAVGGQYSQVVTIETTWTANNSTLEPLNTYLVAYWKAEDIYDSVGSHDLTNNGSVTFTAGKRDNAGTFSGTNYLSSGASTDYVYGTGAYTESFWFRYTADAGYQSMWSRGGSAATLGNGYNIAIAPTTRLLELYNSGTKIQGTTTIQDATWYLLTIVGNGQADGSRTIKMYLNGSQEGSTWTYNYNITYNALWFGSNETYPNDGIVGQIDEVGIWKGHGMTQSEVTALYNSTVGSFYTPDYWDISADTETQYNCDDNLASTVVTDTEGTNGTASTNTTNLNVTGKVGTGAFEFNGTDEYVDIGKTYQTTFQDEFSISFWIKPDDGQPAAPQYIYGMLDNPARDDEFAVWIETDGKIRVNYYSNGDIVQAETASAVFADGASSWTHLTVTLTTTQITIYINGSAVALDGTLNGDMSGATMSNWTSTYKSYLGAGSYSDTASSFFAGSIDDFRVINKALIQKEINGIYNSGSGTSAQSGN